MSHGIAILPRRECVASQDGVRPLEGDKGVQRGFVR
jgi:hypothetical protein